MDSDAWVRALRDEDSPEHERARRAMERLVDAIVAAPDVPPHEISAHVEAQRYLRARSDRTEPLTPAQTRVVELYSHGLQKKEVAAALGVSYETVKNQLARSSTKLGTRHVGHTVAKALRLGLIS